MYSRTPLRRLLQPERIRPCNFICTRCLSSKAPIYDTTSSRIKHLSQLKSTYDIIKELKDVYSTIDSTFIQDVVTELAKSRNEEVKLPLNILRNAKAREYMLKDCCEIVMKDDVDLSLSSLGVLHRAKVLPRHEYQGKDANTLRMEFLQLLMNENQIALATMCILNYIVNDIEVPYPKIKLLIDIISSSSLTDFPMNSYCLLQVLRISTRIDPLELFTSLMYLSSNVNGNYFANHLFFKYVDDEVFAKMSIQQQHWIILSMLEVNLENSDAIKALKIWQVAKPIVLISAPSANQVSSYVEKLINAFQLHHNETLIEQEINNLPACLDTDYMIDYKLFFYAQHSADKFHTLVKTLHSPLRRSSLTSLLRSFIQLRDESNAEKIVSTIFAHSTINSEELQTIVETLLQKGKVSEALSMVQRMNLETSKFSYLMMFKHTWKNRDQAFFKEFYLKFMNLNYDDLLLELFTIELIRAISTLNNRQAVRYYVNFLKKVDFRPYKTNELYQLIDFKRYGFLDEFSQLVRLTPFGMVECLKILSKQTVLDRDPISLRWCFEEFRKSGWEVSTIVEYLEHFDTDGYLRQILKERAFK